MYQVLARKWRPRTLEELIGQQNVARTLRNAIAARRIAHAFLFAGVRGTGKTTVARIVAKCLNCEKGPTPTPCGECTPCLEIADGRAMDVLELDAASRTGVGDIRELQEVVSYAPVRDRYKVLIIDEVHMLSKNAFNALLKTLEEPPAQVVFILATTELHKVLPTILSRCQLFEFRRVTAREIGSLLRKICDAEGVTISERSLDRVARAGEGSVRDALSVLERVLAFCGHDVRDEDALAILGAVRTELLAAMVAAMAARDAAALLTAFDAAAQEGHDLVHLWTEMVSVIRDLIMMRTIASTGDLLARPPEEAATLADASGSLTREDLTRIFQLLADLESGLKLSSQPRFLFESCLLRIVALGSVRPIEEILAGLGSVGEMPQERPNLTRPSRTAPRPPAPPAGDAGGASKKKDLTARPDPGDPAPTPAPLAVASAAAGAGVPAFLAALHGERPMLAVMLEGAVDVTVEGRRLVLAVGPDAEPVRRMLEREDTLSTLRSVAERTLDVVSIEVRAAPGAPAGPAQPAGTARVAEPTAPPPTRAGRDDLFDQVRRDPSIKRLLNEFGAQIVDVRPLAAPPEEGDGGTGLGPEEIG